MTIIAPDGHGYVGLGDVTADLAAGDDYLRIDLYGEPRLWLERVQLNYDATQSFHTDYATEIVYASVQYVSGQSAAGLVKALGPWDALGVGILSGTIVVGFEPIPEPSTALLVACGLVGLALRRRHRSLASGTAHRASRP